jgi:hypothetical protein
MPSEKKPLTVRWLPVGTRFYLLRTMEKFTLIWRGPSALGGYKYIVRRDGATSHTSLHHSCHVKPIIRVGEIVCTPTTNAAAGGLGQRTT